MKLVLLCLLAVLCNGKGNAFCNFELANEMTIDTSKSLNLPYIIDWGKDFPRDYRTTVTCNKNTVDGDDCFHAVSQDPNSEYRHPITRGRLNLASKWLRIGQKAYVKL